MPEASLPPFRIEACEPARREPGMMVFNVRPGGTADGEIPIGWLMAIGQHGETVFCNRYDAPPQDVRALANGNILFSQTDGRDVSCHRRAVAANPR